MSRVSKFLLLGLLALFSSISYAEVLGNYSNKGAASAACESWVSNYNSQNNANQVCYVTPNPDVGYAKALNRYYWNYSTCTPFLMVAGDLCITPPTDEECAAKPDVIHRHSSPASNPTLSPETVVKDGCSYTYGASSGLPSYNCFVAVDGATLLCDATYTTNSQSTNAEQNYDDDQTPGTLSSGGDTTSTTTLGDATTQTDTPSAGDTTTTKTDTETTSYSDQVNVTNNTNSVDVTSLQGGDVTKTTTTETINVSDGSSETNVTTTYTQDITTANTTTINPNAGTTTTKTDTIPGSSGSTTITTKKDASGNTTGKTSTSTGTGGDGNDNGRDDNQEGSCLDNQSCNSDIDSSGAVDGVDGLFDSAVATVTGDNVSAGDFLDNFLQMPSGTCANPSFSHSSTLGSFNSSIDICTKTQDLRDGLGWMFFIITLFVIYRIASGT